MNCRFDAQQVTKVLSVATGMFFQTSFWPLGHCYAPFRVLEGIGDIGIPNAMRPMGRPGTSIMRRTSTAGRMPRAKGPRGHRWAIGRQEGKVWLYHCLRGHRPSLDVGVQEDRWHSRPMPRQSPKTQQCHASFELSLFPQC